jgi:hypothetical protein
MARDGTGMSEEPAVRTNVADWFETIWQVAHQSGYSATSAGI